MSAQTTYPLRPARVVSGGSGGSRKGRAVTTITEALRASTPGVSAITMGLRSGDDASVALNATAPIGNASQHLGSVSPVRGNLSSVLDEDAVSVAPSRLSHPLAQRALPFVASELPGGGARPRQPVTTGFGRLSLAIDNLMQRLPDAPLDEKFDIISKHIEGFCVDVVPHKVARELDTVMATAEQHVREFGGTTAMRAVASTFSMTQLLLLLSRVKPGLAATCRAVSQGMLEVVFVRAPTNVPELLIDAALEQHALLGLLEQFRGKMHFQEARELRKKLDSVQRFVVMNEEVRENQKRVLGHALTHWHSHSKALIFRSWRACVTRSKEQSKHEEALARLRLELSRATETIADLRRQLAEKDAALRQVEARRAAVAREHEDEVLAARYDVLCAQRQADDSEAALRAASQRFAAETESLRTTAATASTALAQITEQLAAFRVVVFGQGARTAEQSSVVAAAGSSNVPRATDATVLSWTNAAIDAVAAASPALIDALRASSAAERCLGPADSPLRVTALRADDAGLTATAICLHYVCPAAMRDGELVAFMLQSVADKASSLLQSIRAAGIPLPHFVTDDLLSGGSDGSHAALRATLGAVLQYCANPLRCGSSGTAAAAAVERRVVELVGGVIPSAAQPLVAPVAEVLREWAAHRDVWLGAEGRFATYVTEQALQVGAALADGGDDATADISAAELGDEPYFALTAQAVAAVGVAANELDAVAGVARRNFRLLRSVFWWYHGGWSSARDSAATATMSEERFLQVVRDARVGRAGALDRTVVVSIVVTLGPITPRTFVVALVAIAKARFADLSCASALRALIDAHLRPMAERIDFSIITRVMREGDVVSVTIDEIRNDLFKIFRRYCNQSPNKMTVPDLAALLRDLESSKEQAAATIDDATEAFHALKASPSDEGIGFEPFVRLLCVVALQRLRQPWIAPELRVRRFLLHIVVDGLRKKLGLQYTSPV